MIRRVLSAFVFCAALFTITSPSSAGELLIPEAWEGVWNLTNTIRPCGTSGGEIEMEPDTLCAGEPFFPEKPGGPVADCTGTVSDTEVDIVCTYTEDVPGPPGCTVTVTITAAATRTGTTYTATETVEEDYAVECGKADTCEETLTTGTLSAADPDCQVVPVESTTWAEIKSTYR